MKKFKSKKLLLALLPLISLLSGFSFVIDSVDTSQNNAVILAAEIIASQLNISNSLVIDGAEGEGYINSENIKDILNIENNTISWTLEEKFSLMKSEVPFSITLTDARIASRVITALVYNNGVWDVDEFLSQFYIVSYTIAVATQLNINNNLTIDGPDSDGYINQYNLRDVVNHDNGIIHWTLDKENSVIEADLPFSVELPNGMITERVMNALIYVDGNWGFDEFLIQSEIGTYARALVNQLNINNNLVLNGNGNSYINADNFNNIVRMENGSISWTLYANRNSLGVDIPFSISLPASGISEQIINVIIYNNDRWEVIEAFIESEAPVRNSRLLGDSIINRYLQLRRSSNN
ncbi:MAG: hypothetical protein FWF57_01830 [Defluviitaleaceae bacterium]|nr:hypothetical protein [Defluviitaleaceae bacterium]